MWMFIINGAQTGSPPQIYFPHLKNPIIHVHSLVFFPIWRQQLPFFWTELPFTSTVQRNPGGLKFIFRYMTDLQVNKNYA